MGNKKRYSVGISKVGEGVDAELPGNMKSLGTIQKVTKELCEWQGKNDKRAFFLITASEDLQKALLRACNLQEETDIDNDSNKQFN